MKGFWFIAVIVVFCLSMMNGNSYGAIGILGIGFLGYAISYFSQSANNKFLSNKILELTNKQQEYEKRLADIGNAEQEIAALKADNRRLFLKLKEVQKANSAPFQAVEEQEEVVQELTPIVSEAKERIINLVADVLSLGQSQETTAISFEAATQLFTQPLYTEPVLTKNPIVIESELKEDEVKQEETKPAADSFGYVSIAQNDSYNPQ